MRLNERQSTATRAEHDAHFLFFFSGNLVGENSGIAKSLARSRQCHRHSPRHMLSIFGIELSLPIEVWNLRGDLYLRLGNVERLNAAHTTVAVLQAGPERRAPNTDGRDTPHAGDDNAARTFEVVQHATLVSCRRRPSIPSGCVRQ